MRGSVFVLQPVERDRMLDDRGTEGLELLAEGEFGDVRGGVYVVPTPGAVLVTLGMIGFAPRRRR
jgi:hypothetical protein